MSFVVVIPARYESTRLPKKLLLKINDKPLIYYTWLQAKKSSASRVIIATDNQEIFNACENFGAEVCLTDIHHQSGTERIAEVVEQYQFDKNTILVNLQGDEPLIPPDYLTEVAKGLHNDKTAVMATLATKVFSDLNNPNMVKVVFDKNNHALLFSRSLIPYPQKDTESFEQHRHLGIYAYRVDFLQKYHQLSRSDLETIESLEQLRVLWHGYKIKICVVPIMSGPGVDTQADFEQVKQILST